jgi:hypothetical protein
MRRTNEEKFRLLWNRLAETGELNKVVVWKKLKLGKDLMSVKCPACNEVRKMECCRCPIDWPKNNNCIKKESLWHQWRHSTSASKRKKIAARIAKLEWRKK